MVNEIYSLPELAFVGGSSEELIFHAYRDGTEPKPFGLTGCTANFSIAHYADKSGTPLLSKEMTIKMDSANVYENILTILLDAEDTIDLFGKYVYQITVKDSDARADIRQGILMVHKNVDKTFLQD